MKQYSLIIEVNLRDNSHDKIDIFFSRFYGNYSDVKVCTKS